MATVTLIWTLPTTRTDGSALLLTDIVEVDIFDAVNGAAASQIATVSGPATTYTTGVLVEGAHIFTAFAKDSGGRVSASSNPATITVPSTAAPSPITGLTAALNP